MKKAYTIFGRKHVYEDPFNIEQDIRAIDDIMMQVDSQVMLSYAGLETAEFYSKDDDNFIGKDCFRWLAGVYLKSDTEGIRERILELSVEDVEKTAKRNEGLTGVFYRCITLNTDAQQAVRDHLSKAKADLESMLVAWQQDIDHAQAADMQHKALYTVSKVHRSIKPSGGETGMDGYFDAEYTDATTGDVIRMVTRDVYDFGCFSYPKRVEGTEEALVDEGWLESEKNLRNWLDKHGPFKGIRQ